MIIKKHSVLAIVFFVYIFEHFQNLHSFKLLSREFQSLTPAVDMQSCFFFILTYFCLKLFFPRNDVIYIVYHRLNPKQKIIFINWMNFYTNDMTLLQY